MRGGKKQPMLDVKSDADIPALDELRKKHIIVFVNVYADWCGHCHTYKPMLEEFSKIPGRKFPMVRINEKVLAKTPAANAKLKGFPSNIIMGNDGSFAEFKDEEGQLTHAVPNMRDKKAMRVLLLSDPSKLTKNTYSNDSTPQPTKTAENLLAASGKRVYKNKNTPVENMDKPVRPNMEADTNTGKGTYVHKPLSKNGSLYKTLESLLQEDGAEVPAAAAPPRATSRRARRKLRKTAKAQ